MINKHFLVKVSDIYVYEIYVFDSQYSNYKEGSDKRKR